MMANWMDQAEFQLLRDLLAARLWSPDMGFDRDTLAASALSRLYELAVRFDGPAYKCYRDGWVVGVGRLSPELFAIKLGFGAEHAELLVAALLKSDYLTSSPRLGLIVSHWDTKLAPSLVHKWLVGKTLTFASGKRPKLSDFEIRPKDPKKVVAGKRYRDVIEDDYFQKYGRPLMDDPLQPTFQFSVESPQWAPAGDSLVSPASRAELLEAELGPGWKVEP